MSSYKILITDHSEAIESILAKAFEKARNNFTLLFAPDYNTLDVFAIESEPDLLLINLTHHEAEGIEAIQNFKKNRKTRYIPIIAMCPKSIFKEAYEAGADDFIAFPVDEFELFVRIRRTVNLIDNIRKINDQNERLKLQNEGIIIQHNMLAEANKEIIDDINYSLRIQNAILPPKELLNQLLPKHFIFYKPKSIVSGDFYWVTQKDNYVIIAAADCTGHGISGAFMTVAGTAFLNEIASMPGIINANEILNLLRNRVMRLLRQCGAEGETNDGMDISLCIFDLKNQTLQYSGANNPIYIVRQNDDIEIIKADKIPIGIHYHFNQPFINHLIKLNTDDVVYMFSDGYADQFGGLNDQKFRYKRLQDLCVQIHELKMEEQAIIIEQCFYNWIGDRKQVDDILIIGIKI